MPGAIHKCSSGLLMTDEATTKYQPGLPCLCLVMDYDPSAGGVCEELFKHLLNSYALEAYL